MKKNFFPFYILGISLYGYIGTFAIDQASAAQWNPNSKIQMKCSKHYTPKKCNKDKECFWEPIQPQCVGYKAGSGCSKFMTDEKACKEAENKGCYWFMPSEEELKHAGYCFEKGPVPEKGKKE